MKTDDTKCLSDFQQFTLLISKEPPALAFSLGAFHSELRSKLIKFSLYFLNFIWTFTKCLSQHKPLRSTFLSYIRIFPSYVIQPISAILGISYVNISLTQFDWLSWIFTWHGNRLTNHISWEFDVTKGLRRFRAAIPSIRYFRITNNSNHPSPNNSSIDPYSS